MHSFSPSTVAKVWKVTGPSALNVSQSATWVAFLARKRCYSTVRNGSRRRRMMGTATFATSGTLRTTPDITSMGGNEQTMEWGDLGLRKSVIEGVMRAYPDVVAPTAAQAKLIPAILEGKDVLVKDDAGTGKSFGIALGLLGKPRVKYVVKGKAGEEQDSVTALILVPQSNLAHQYYQWICRIAEASNKSMGVDLEMDRIVQRLVREQQQHLLAGMKKLHDAKPHILISTPQAMLDVYGKDPDLIMLPYLSTVVVDEVDYQVETVPKKDPERSYSKAFDKAVQRIQKHPGPTRELLDLIYVARKEVNSQDGEWEWDFENDRPYRKGGGSVGMKKMPGPQLVLASATLRTHLSNYLYEESGWLNKANMVKVKKPSTQPKRKEGEESVEEDRRVREAAKSGRVKHCVIEVSDTEIRNVEGAVVVEDDGMTDNNNSNSKDLEAQEEIFSGWTGDRPRMDHGTELQAAFIERYQKTASPFNPNALEAIATAVALDVPKLALLIIPSSMPVFRAVYELREMGLDARVFDPQKQVTSGDENPAVLVTTVAMARGLDLPNATHVFSLGIPDGPRVTGRSIDAYTHVSGRVGRFGRRGTVVSVVEAGEGESMRRILRELGVAPVRFRQFK